MIIGIGTDIIEIARVAKAIEKIEFVNKVFTAHEVAYCESKKKAENFAARFAAKEAFFKAMGTGWREGMSILEVEIQNDDLGKPSIVLSGVCLSKFEAAGGKKIYLTLSHNKDSAIAFVVLES